MDYLKTSILLNILCTMYSTNCGYVKVAKLHSINYSVAALLYYFVNQLMTNISPRVTLFWRAQEWLI